jgi:hypothetical protein
MSNNTLKLKVTRMKELKDIESRLKGATCVILKPADNESYSTAERLEANITKNLSQQADLIIIIIFYKDT